MTTLVIRAGGIGELIERLPQVEDLLTRGYTSGVWSSESNWDLKEDE